MVGPYLCKKQRKTAIILCIQWGKQRRWLSHLCRYIGKRANLYGECLCIQWVKQRRGCPTSADISGKGQVVQIVRCCLISVNVVDVRKRLHRMMNIDTNKVSHTVCNTGMHDVSSLVHRDHAAGWLDSDAGGTSNEYSLWKPRTSIKMLVSDCPQQRTTYYHTTVLLVRYKVELTTYVHMHQL